MDKKTPRSVATLVFLVMLAAVGCSSHGGHAEEAPPPDATPAATAGEAAGSGQDCTSEADCGEGEYCARPIGVCATEPGTCAEKPQMCTQDWTPVCSCDGKTYGNRCGAAAAGQNVAHEGECPEPTRS